MNVAAVSTSGDNALLRAIRTTLADASSSLLCVAFANPQGVNLLQPQLKRLGNHARVLVTTVFGSSNPLALNMLRDLGTEIRVQNPSGGTYHPKLYLGARGMATAAVVGSANLTGGLATNIELGALMKGRRTEDELSRLWNWAEELWARDTSVPWQPTGDVQEDLLDPELFEAIRTEVRREPYFYTLTEHKPNYVREATPSGLYVETDRTKLQGKEPQLVPAWMIQIAWDYLRAHGELTNAFLLDGDGLNVKRSSAVCAILARMPGVSVISMRPITLRLKRG